MAALQKKPTSGKYSLITLIAKKNIKRMREESGMTVYEFGKAIGVSSKKVEDIETLCDYGCFLSLDVAAKISDHFGITIDDLIKP